MFAKFTKLSKEELLKQLEDLMENGQSVIAINKFRDYEEDFMEFGFKYFITMSVEEFDEVYVNEKTALLFHDAFNSFSLEFIHGVIEDEEEILLNTFLSFGRH